MSGSPTLTDDLEVISMESSELVRILTDTGLELQQATVDIQRQQVLVMNQILRLQEKLVTLRFGLRMIEGIKIKESVPEEIVVPTGE